MVEVCVGMKKIYGLEGGAKPILNYPDKTPTKPVIQPKTQGWVV